MRKVSHAFSCKHKVVSAAVKEELKVTQHELEVEWDQRRQRMATGQQYVYSTGVYHQLPGIETLADLLSAAPVGDIESGQFVFFITLVVAAILHIVCNLSLVPAGFLLGGIRIILKMEGRDPQQPDAHIPKDMRTVLKRLDLYPKYSAYVCCPKCFQLYDIDNYPDLCSKKSTPNSPPCKCRLCCPAAPAPAHSTNADQRHPMTPVRSYHYQDMKQWIN